MEVLILNDGAIRTTSSIAAMKSSPHQTPAPSDYTLTSCPACHSFSAVPDFMNCWPGLPSKTSPSTSRAFSICDRISAHSLAAVELSDDLSNFPQGNWVGFWGSSKLVPPWCCPKVLLRVHSELVPHLWACQFPAAAPRENTSPGKLPSSVPCLPVLPMTTRKFKCCPLRYR